MGARVGRFWKGEQQKFHMQKRRPERMRAGTCPSDSSGWGQKVDGTQTRLQ